MSSPIDNISYLVTTYRNIVSSNTDGKFSSVIDMSDRLVGHRSIMALCVLATLLFIAIPVIGLVMLSLGNELMLDMDNVVTMIAIGVGFGVLTLLVHYKGFNDTKALAYKKKLIPVSDDIMNVAIDYFDIELTVDELSLNQIDIIFKTAISYELSRTDCNDITDKIIEMEQGFRHNG